MEGSAPPPKHNFIHEMRKYMPGDHRRFLEHVFMCANIREFVEARKSDLELCAAYDGCLAMLQAFRDKHIAIVTRYVVLKSRETPPWTRDESVKHRQNLALASSSNDQDGKRLRGTGGTALLPFLKQARDETVEPAIVPWTRKTIHRRVVSSGKGQPVADKVADGKILHTRSEPVLKPEANLLAGSWSADIAGDSGGGGLCHY